MNRKLHIALSVFVLLWCSLCVSAHEGEHGAAPVVAPDADWMTRHMAEEHHISGFDASTFFTLHDYDNTGLWSAHDIRRTYGLEDASTASVPEEKKQAIVQTVLDMFDGDQDGLISSSEFVQKYNEGKTLPDFGMGPGHHGDYEYEYEIHHFEKFHSGPDVKLEDLTHPEDIEHFKKHEEIEAQQEEWEQLELRGIVEKNIPAKFRRS